MLSETMILNTAKINNELFIKEEKRIPLFSILVVNKEVLESQELLLPHGTGCQNPKTFKGNKADSLLLSAYYLYRHSVSSIAF